MAKQQTLTIIVDDDMADPALLVEVAFEHYLYAGPIRPEYGDDPEEEFAQRSSPYMILEED